MISVSEAKQLFLERNKYREEAKRLRAVIAEVSELAHCNVYSDSFNLNRIAVLVDSVLDEEPL